MAEGSKLDMSGKPVNDLPATYKTIPEADMEEEAVMRPKSLIKLKSTSPEVDGADERMLPNEEKIVPNSTIDAADVKISEKQNGDAKLDIGELKSAFVGLTKEELMKYAHDPFWVRLRWFLFITFWLLWAAMLVGAIMIIYAAPKCDPPPPRTWWQEGPLSEVRHDIQLEQLKSLKDKGVKGIIVSWPEDSYTTFDETHDFVKLLRKSKDDGVINVIVELEPGSSSVWFEKSEQKSSDLIDYYIWKQPTSITEPPTAPNNWKSIYNESAWSYSKIRKEFFYAPNRKPQLNFRNPKVIEEFSNVIKKFLDYGAAGVRIRGAPYLLVDSKFEDEPIRHNVRHDYTLNDYGFYVHTKTENLLELGPLLKQWHTIVKNKTENGPFMAAEHLTNIEAYKVNNSLVIDLPLESHLFMKQNLTATNIVRGLNTVFNIDNISWPLWKVNSSSVLDIVTFLLPGAPLISENAPINTELLKIRSSPSIMRGSLNFYAVRNQTVFAFIRVTSGNPGVLVAFNPTDHRLVVDFPSEIENVSEEVTVQLFSNNYNESDITLTVKQDGHNIPMSPKSVIVLSYVPKTQTNN